MGFATPAALEDETSDPEFLTKCRMRKAKAENKITMFLDHIRDEYRNPVSHPDETLSLQDAFNLFGAAYSAISQMLTEIDTTENAKSVNALSAAANVLASALTTTALPASTANETGIP